MLGYKGGGFNLNIVDITHIEDQNFCKAGTQHPLNLQNKKHSKRLVEKLNLKNYHIEKSFSFEKSLFSGFPVIKVRYLILADCSAPVTY